MKRDRKQDVKKEYRPCYDYKKKLEEQIAGLKKRTKTKLLTYIVVEFALFLIIIKVKDIIDADLNIKELVIYLAFTVVGTMIFMILNYFDMKRTEKKLYSVGDVCPELKDISVEHYRDILKRMERDKLLEMYRDIYTNDRRNIDISMKSITGAILSISLPSLATYICSQIENMSNSDVWNMYFAFLMMIPYFLEIALYIINIIHGDDVNKSLSLEKYAQDKIVKELVSKKLGIKVE